VHLAEESHRPEITVPRAMMTAFIVGTVGAFVICVVLLYGITDVMAVLTSTTGSPVVEIVSSSRVD
jgi:choline transport protein